MSYCPDCDQSVTMDVYITGAVVNYHTDRYHDWYRSAIAVGLRDALLARVAVQGGHRVTIRFTADYAWYECSCGHVGQLWRSSAPAVADGRTHLTHCGVTLAGAA